MKIVVPGPPVSSGASASARRDFAKRVTKAVEDAGVEISTGPILLAVTFTFERPRSHFGSGRNADKIKPSAPAFPTGAPSLLKLVESLLDALGAHLRAETDVVRVDARKIFGEPSTAVVLRYA